MVPTLQTVYANPIEREYEAWIVEGIERYFRRVGQNAAVWAVSPTFEPAWPADEVLTIRGKLVGLQFKKARLAAGIRTYDRLTWSLASPKGQYAAVQAASEIYYVLPTFVNRTYRREALHHCFFWRPPAGTADVQAWYDNSKAVTQHRQLAKAPEARRWGGMIEAIQSCDAGRRVTGIKDVRSYLRGLQDIWKENKLLRTRPRSHSDDQGTDAPDQSPPKSRDGHDGDREELVAPLYLVYLPLKRVRR